LVSGSSCASSSETLSWKEELHNRQEAFMVSQACALLKLHKPLHSTSLLFPAICKHQTKGVVPTDLKTTLHSNVLSHHSPKKSTVFSPFIQQLHPPYISNHFCLRTNNLFSDTTGSDNLEMMSHRIKEPNVNPCNWKILFGERDWFKNFLYSFIAVWKEWLLPSCLLLVPYLPGGKILVHLEGMVCCYFGKFLSSKGFLVDCCELPMVALTVKLWFSPSPWQPSVVFYPAFWCPQFNVVFVKGRYCQAFPDMSYVWGYPCPACAPAAIQ
jgi:hypothetical protein